MTAGYSRTPLPAKLGIKPGTDVLLLGDPLSFDLAALQTPVDRMPGGLYPVVLLFCPDRATLNGLFEPAKARQTVAGAVWVCWPKKSSGIVTDLDETSVREFGLANERVDVKVAAIDTTWSGLKFVTRRADRVRTAGP
ncbi:hypothetical protein SAMN04515671_1858 [Nakamurella panacisegetis]|uniref:DUF3052 domain-containing protein n=1 Tax=Nakamurella panacisegetis TaxID=1090615 RepID=A0A1H0LY99_9ACTN|nr:DUF3052 domain-containing protein [Nakamurella panacisegetis]SDO73212.1 hypothetical protein SAMN04515671_1858 [Nakamurella panacisegetis]